MPDWLLLVIMSMATWRVAIMLTSEDGPFDVFTKIRSLLGIEHHDDGSIMKVPGNTVAKLFCCLWCMSIWIGGIIYIVGQFSMIPVWILAISSGAILFDRLKE